MAIPYSPYSHVTPLAWLFSFKLNQRYISVKLTGPTWERLMDEVCECYRSAPPSPLGREIMEIPSGLYAIVGILVVTNLSTVGALIVFIFKCGVFVSDTRSGISNAKETGIRAHQRIDKIEDGLPKNHP